jgi:hypothetical protein
MHFYKIKVHLGEPPSLQKALVMTDGATSAPLEFPLID